MAPRLVVGKLKGASSQNNWSYVYDSKDEYPDSEKGRLLLVISLLTPAAIGEEIVNKEISSFIRKFFFALSKSTFSSLKFCLENLYKELLKKNIETSFSGILYDGDAVYVAAAGGGEVSIFREGGFSKLLISSSDTIVASGYPKDGDVLYCITAQFYSALSEVSVQKALKSELSIDRRHMTGFLATITPRFNASVSRAAGAFCLFDADTEIKPTKSLFPMTTEKALSESDNQPRQLNERSLAGSVRTFESPISSVRRSPFSVVNFSVFKRLLPQKDTIQIEHEHVTLDDAKKKNTLRLGVLIIILLVISIGYGGHKKRQEDIKLQYLPRLEEAKHQLDEALAVMSISPDRARDHFQESNRLISELNQEGIDDPQLIQLTSRLEEERGKILGEYLSTLQTYVDLSLQSDGFRGNDIFTTEDEMYVLDTETNRAISIELDSKKSEVIAGPGSIDSAHYITAYNGLVFITTNNGIVRIDSGKRIVVEDSFTDNSLPYSYAANVYVVEVSESRIYRYVGFEGGLSDKDEWLSESAEPDLSKIRSITIDGNIWMVSSSGGIFKFSLGNQVNFNLTGVVPAFTNPIQIYTNEELTYLYVLEPDQKRIVVLTKEGVFVAQYIADGLTEAVDFGVNEEEKQMYVLTGEKIESIDLRHL